MFNNERASRSRIVLFTAAMLAGALVHAQSADELAKQLSNPIASLTSVPIQVNYDDGLNAHGDGSRLLINIQPVVPFSLNDRWNLISRTILPLTSQGDILIGSGSQSGTGDILQSLFFSPKALTASGWTWGVGPALLVPTASDDLLGTGKWAAGPTVVALTQIEGGWTYGVLMNHFWSFAGDSERAAVSSTFLQPFVAKGLGKGRTLSFNFESSYDWKSRQWTAPFNAGYSQVIKIGSQRISLQGGVRYYVEAPAGGPDWGLRLTFTLLYPKA
jgi:hypothetical protein